MPSYLEEDIFAMDITDGCPMFRDQLLKLLVKMKPRLEEMPDTVDLLILLIQVLRIIIPFSNIHCFTFRRSIFFYFLLILSN